ncbi:hypothetical protein NBRC116583_31570 [Arenicella sp. 4NH20-0111]|uniref:cell division protein FtsQ/DivIB n=1 Tax=Arenicella sp. 4NH20-0111 TaxID=3127648 RepID=UPI00310C7E1A
MSKSRALANQERQVQVQKVLRLAKAMLLATATIMTFSTVILLIADNLYRPDAFKIEQIKFKGAFVNLTPEEVQTVVQKEKMGNYFSVELDKIKKQVEAIDWVRSADVRREWPDTLLISLKEHRPVMKWQTVGETTSNKSGTEKWVSLAGSVITIDEPLDLRSPLVLNGPDHDAGQMLLKAVQWQKRLAMSGLEIRSITLSASQAWSMELALDTKGSTFELLLGRENIVQRLDRFLVLFDRQFKGRGVSLLRVDARYPDGLAVDQREAEASSTVEILGVSNRGCFSNHQFECGAVRGGQQA